MKFSVIGLGKLGASMAAAIASRGFTVTGVDIDPRSVEKLARGEAPVSETDLAAFIVANRDRLRATMDVAEAVAQSDVTFVVVPTPSDARGAFSTQFAEAAFESVGKALGAKKGYHVVVLTSTVLPGATRERLIPILERASRKECGRDFGACYSPEFIALGSVIRDFLNPDFNLIGEFDAKSGDVLSEAYRGIMTNAAPAHRMSIENAELTKITLNAYVTMKMSFANLVAELCEQIPSGNVDVVTNALGADKRIGRKYLTGATGYGGPCFPRDNLALAFFAESVGVRADLPRTVDDFNRTMPRRLMDRLGPILRGAKRVAVLGLAYKPNSHVTDESPGIALCQELHRQGFDVKAFDPLAGAAARTKLGSAASVVDDVETCVRGADVVLVATNDQTFRNLRSRFTNPVWVDFWRILDGDRTPSRQYFPVGTCLDSNAARTRLAKLWQPGPETVSGTAKAQRVR